MVRKLICLASVLLGLSMTCMANATTTAEANNYAVKIDSFYKNNQLDSALVYCDKLISLDSINTEYYIIKANIAANIGNYEDALGTTQKAIKINPTDVEAILTQSSIQLAMSRFDDALKTIDDGLVKNPNDSKLIINKAAFYKYKGDTINTISICKELLKNKNAEKDTRYQAHDMIINCTPASSLENAIDAMVKDMGAKDYKTLAFATQICNIHELYGKADKYKKSVFKLHDKQKIEDKLMFIDEYRHGFTLVQVFEYFNPKDAGSMPVQYLFRVYLDSGNNEWQYNIRVEYFTDIMGQYKSQMAVMATLSNDGFRTYWETLSEVKSTSYKQWKEKANQIIDNKLKVGSSTIIGKDKKSTITIGGDGDSEDK